MGAKGLHTSSVVGGICPSPHVTFHAPSPHLSLIMAPLHISLFSTSATSTPATHILPLVTELTGN